MVGAVIDETTSNLKLWHLDPERAAVLLFNGNATIDSAGVSEDGSRLMGFIGIGLSDLTSGAPQLVSLLPDGSVPSCGVADVESFPFKKWKHRISADGSMAFFSSRGNNCTGPARTYIRYLDTGQSKLISPPPVSGAECDSVFVSSTPDAVFLWSKSRFSAEDTAPKTCEEGARNGDIYRYDLHDETLKCVTCVLPGVDADVYVLQSNGIWRTGESILVSEDGSRVYFQSPHALVPGAPDVKDRGSTYRVNVNTGDLAWVGGPEIGLGAEQTTATPDGSTLLFDSDRPFLNPLNGSNNSGTRQYYRYDDRDRSLVCVSCPTDGGNPRAAVRPLRGSEAQGISQLSDDGKIIAFSTPTPLLGSDQNTSGPAGSPENGLDVYEWRDGQYLLVTDGLTNSTPGTEGPTAAGMSASGRDIFFGAATQYTPDALDGYRRLYDARIDGGFIHPTAPPPCPLEVCQGTPKGAPEERAPGTGTFAGPGNLKPRRAKHKKHAKKHHRKAANKHAKHRANNNRRTAR